MNSSKVIHRALSDVVPQFRLNLNHGWHGISHWSRVWRNARELCEVMNVDPLVPCLFAYYHDSQRFDEGSDAKHGPRAVKWLQHLFMSRRLDIKPAHFMLLCEAIQRHSDGYTDADPIVQICWDADRLDLGRVGIRPDSKYLCTPYAKRPEVIQQAWLRSVGKAQNS